MNLQLGTVARPASASTAVPAAAAPATASRPGAVPPPPLAVPAKSQVKDATPPGAGELKEATRQINEFLKSSATSVEFSVDEQLNRVIVRVLDSETNELIRQIPSEETMAISHALDRMTGLLLKQKA